MSKVITFSRVFPKYHPKAGEPTYFVEKILNGLISIGDYYDMDKIPNWTDDFCATVDARIEGTKFHTIRAGHRWKVGDIFSPRVWSGKPYNSKQIIIAPDIEIEKIFPFSTNKDGYFLNGNQIGLVGLSILAKNDGLEVDDFECWFNKSNFDGQIICWNKNIEY